MPFAALMIFLCFAEAVTPRLTHIILYSQCSFYVFRHAAFNDSGGFDITLARFTLLREHMISERTATDEFAGTG